MKISLRKALTVFGILAILTILSGWIQADESGAQKSPRTEQTQVEQQVPPTDHLSDPMEGIQRFFSYTGFANATWGHIIMIAVGLFFIFLAIRYDY
ncbi:MAG: hypothetical protein R2759_16825 [Bacteroidales bacterium]